MVCDVLSNSDPSLRQEPAFVTEVATATCSRIVE